VSRIAARSRSATRCTRDTTNPAAVLPGSRSVVQVKAVSQGQSRAVKAVSQGQSRPVKVCASRLLGGDAAARAVYLPPRRRGTKARARRLPGRRARSLIHAPRATAATPLRAACRMVGWTIRIHRQERLLSYCIMGKLLRKLLRKLLHHGSIDEKHRSWESYCESYRIMEALMRSIDHGKVTAKVTASWKHR
jgi:hypothetical protein